MFGHQKVVLCLSLPYQKTRQEKQQSSSVCFQRHSLFSLSSFHLNKPLSVGHWFVLQHHLRGNVNLEIVNFLHSPLQSNISGGRGTLTHPQIFSLRKFNLMQKNILSNYLNFALKWKGKAIIKIIVEELKTNLMSLVVFISLIFAQNVSNINMSIFRSLRL